MIDIHCHILSYVDDGACSLDISLEMLREQAKQGVSTVCLTPHLRDGMFIAGDEMVVRQYFYLRKMVRRYDIPVQLYLSREYYADSLFCEKLRHKTIIPMGTGKFVLIEFSDSHSFEEMKAYICMIEDEGYIPLVAHPERYVVLRRNFEHAEELYDRGVYFQCNAETVMGNIISRENGFGKIRFVKRLIQRNLLYAVGSDAHNLKSRKPNLGECRKYLKKEKGTAYAEELLEKNPAKILHIRGRSFE